MRRLPIALCLLALSGCGAFSKSVEVPVATIVADPLTDADAIWARETSPAGGIHGLAWDGDGPLAGARLLGRVLESVGGREAWHGVTAYSTRGSSAVQTDYGEISVASASTVSGAGRVRVEQNTPVGNVLVRVDGERAALNVDGTDRQPPPGFVESVRAQLLFTLPYALMNAASLRVARAPDVDGLAALRYAVEGVGAVYEARLGADGRPVEIHSVQPGPAGLSRLVYTVSDYRDVSGLTVPHRYTQTADDVRTGSTTITVFRVNPDVSAESFGG